MASRNFNFDFGEHFGSLIRECEGEFRFRGGTATEVREWQVPFRQSLRRILGLANMEQDLAGFTPDAELLDRLDLGSYIREEWRIRTEPTVPLPFYLLRPKSGPPNPPLVLTPHGHGHPHIYVGLFRNDKDDKEEAEIREGERDIAVRAVAQGYLVIAPTTRAFGETRSPAAPRRDAGCGRPGRAAPLPGRRRPRRPDLPRRPHQGRFRSARSFIVEFGAR